MLNITEEKLNLILEINKKIELAKNYSSVSKRAARMGRKR